MSQKSFRFAAQLSASPDGTAKGWKDQAKKAEDLGYSSLHVPDHFGEQLAPVPAIMSALDATTTLKVGAMVFDNDYRHPFVFAKEASSLDVLSDGRFELSLGAGWMKSDYETSGIPYDSPKVRVDRFEEAVTIIKGLLSSTEPYSFNGEHYEIFEHTLFPKPVQIPNPPLIIGGGGKRVLSIAGRHGDIVSINVDLREGTGGPETAPNATPDRTKEKVQWVKEAAGSRFDEIELHTLVGFAMITDESHSIIEAMAPHFGISPSDALHVPLALIGTIDEMEEELQWRRTEYGISYISFEASCWEALGPLVGRLSGK